MKKAANRVFTAFPFLDNRPYATSMASPFSL